MKKKPTLLKLEKQPTELKRNQMRAYVPLGEWQLGPGKSIEFRAEPIPLEGRSCLVEFGSGYLIVRVESVDTSGKAFGEVVGNIPPDNVPTVTASELMALGIEALARRNGGA